jgi:hypothetical protein
LREIVQQVMTVLKYKGTKIGEDNVNARIGPKWAWIVKLAEALPFEVGEWQPKDVQAAIAEHNAKVKSL